ncbi:precorrin-6y C5,15-methyltransferase (decarboxylating) subunit CbiE [Nakamurella antarctica]|uniref:Precorrin-6y C5,15-methyltransferase (Decarboxylating) subunit CbiE n=1 Tax=Nakamurella antarctica TaxID=1902245 RepID=A0A3G8ZQE0_9ACTN|nr:precorrin-6y C5,15-methyltransferase (decarboxylating) subunit CbiE [Nakamurella antarctica]AZI59017.1 precorrin-6y C5,15-methyltransferase (decarboxylating) subunit CbiE [Nakamurella antarctica]
MRAPDHPRTVSIVGLPAGGWAELGEQARSRIAAASVVVGSARQLDLVPTHPAQTQRAWPSPLLPALAAILTENENSDVVVLASGDPLVSGIGSTIIALIGAARVHILPAVSSLALARAAMGWASETTVAVTLVGRDPHAVLRELAPGRRVIVLSSDSRTPQRVADLLVGAGYGTSTITVLGNLGTTKAFRASACAESWPSGEVPALNLLCIECRPSPETVLLAAVPGLPDDAFEHDGQITKRDVRASALARLAPVPGQLLWDVGAGAGSVAVEWARSHPTCRAIAVEKNSERAQRIARNASMLGVPSVQIVISSAPSGLADLEAPHAVFVGGGATAPGVLESCWEALLPGGRFVVHGVTLETEGVLFQWFTRLGGELIQLAVSRAEAIGTFTGFTPARPITQWSITKRSTSQHSATPKQANEQNVQGDL